MIKKILMMKDECKRLNCEQYELEKFLMAELTKEYPNNKIQYIPLSSYAIEIRIDE